MRASRRAGLFHILARGDGPDTALVASYERFLADNQIHIAGIEFIVDRKGVVWTYDVNTNTNYNSEAETVAGQFGMRAIAEYLGRELAVLRPVGMSA